MVTRPLQTIVLSALIALPLAALDTGSIKRSEPERRGRVWEERVEFEAPAEEGGRLLLRASNGGVSIHPQPGEKVGCVVTLRAHTADEAEARRLFDMYQVSARAADSGGVKITSQSPPHALHGTNFEVLLQVAVPQTYNLDVVTQSGDISVDEPLKGDARLTTAGGDVRASGLSGAAKIETAGGSIILGNMGGDLVAETAGGSIHVGEVQGDARLQTFGGEIVTGTVKGALKAETAGGDITVGGAGGEVAAQTAGGQIHIGATGGTVRAETAGGSIRLQSSRGRVVAETAGGSIDLLSIAGGVRASTAAGRILA